MSERVFLRALEIEDYKLISKWRNDINVTRYLCGNAYFVSSEREKKSIENKILDDSRNLYLGVCLIEDERIIGYVQINNIDLRNQKAEWGGTLIGERGLLGKGYGEEASRLLLKFLFEQYPINKCYGYCLSEHPVTASLFEKFGFRKDGVLRQEVFKNGEFKDILLYSILRNEIVGRF